MRAFFKTEKGTELPIRNLRGQEYLDVKYRLVWFRENHPDWSIQTEYVEIGEDYAFAKATISDEQGRVISTSHKYEDKKGFPDFHEKGETGAIGRALALIGYGTQFCADELDEGERIVDSPITPKTEAAKPEAGFIPKSLGRFEPVIIKEPIGTEPGDFICPLKKYQDIKIRDIGEQDLNGYVKWLKSPKGQPYAQTAGAKAFIVAADVYLKSMEFNREGKQS